jgi:stage II sporulation protein D
MSRSLLVVTVLVAAVALAPTPHAAPSRVHRSAATPTPLYVAPSNSGALFLVRGHGSGHGVGMGQWGAQGYALQSYTYQQILAAYYPGTSLGQAPVTAIRVLLADQRAKLALSSEQPMTVEDGDGIQHTLPAGQATLTPSLMLAVDGGPAQPLPPPLTFSPAEGATLSLGGAYRGQIVVDVVNGKLRAVNVVPLEEYLYGVVPSEMPSSWLPAALEAQAVAARSYALASRRAGAPFDVYADTRSQVYRGVAAETAEATQAVDATAGQVLLYGGGIATAVYSASSGGWTESAADAWSGAGKPYLISVRDPYDTISPYHDWGPVPVPAKTLAQKLQLQGRIVDATVTKNSSRRVSALEVSSLQGGTESIESVAGAAATSALGLRSTWFSVGVLSLQPPLPDRPVPYGTRVRLTGVVRGVKGVVVQQRSRRVPWAQLRTVAPSARTGAFGLTVRAAATSDYRLATAADAAAFVRIRVEPRVRLSRASRRSVSGRERPALPGARVLVQQQLTSDSHRWKTVARGAVAAGGHFRVPARLRPGAVRVVVVPGKGWWPGASNGATVKQ